jgi:acyl-CoA thioesterase FadM
MDWDEPVAVGIRIARFGTKSYEMRHEVWSERTGKRTAVLLGTMVAFDYPANKSIAVPAEWRARALAFEAVAPEGAQGTGTRDEAVKE